jgi:putative ATP-dependent endonuclease of the OLD family
MRIRALTVSNFQCFGPNPTTLNLDDLTAFIGANGAGKTAALEALVRLFGSIPAERRLTLADFHVPPAVEDDEEPEKLTLYLEARLEFSELAEGQVGAVPGCFNQMVVEAPGAVPFCRVRLDATWRHRISHELHATGEQLAFKVTVAGAK